ncbi:MAG: PAS domain S-box protein [Verrucomicrobiota bacterium]
MDKPLPTPQRKHRMFKLLGFTLVPVGITAVAVLTAGLIAEVRSVIMSHDPGSLEAIRSTRASAVTAFFQERHKQTALLAQTFDIATSLADFSRAFETLQQDIANSPEGPSAWKSDLATHLAQSPPSQQPNAPAISSYLEQSPVTLFLQSLYVAKSPRTVTHPAGAAYQTAHKRWNSEIRLLSKLEQAQDLLLVDLEGNVVYSTQKHLDFGVNLRKAPHVPPSVKAIFEGALHVSDKSQAIHTDFVPYPFGDNRPSMFWSAPVFSGTTKVGVLLIRRSSKDLDEIMASPVGLGKSGVTYLVGSDLQLRSSSHLDSDSSNAQNRVDAELARRAIAGETLSLKHLDYRQKFVLGAAIPLKIDDLRWALIAETDYDEVMQPTEILTQRIILSAVIFAVSSSSVLLFLLNRIVLSPLVSLSKAAKKLRKNDAGETLEGEGCREIQDLANTLNDLLHTVRSDIEEREAVSLKLRETEERTRAILQLLPDGLVVVNRDGRIEMANERIHAICGYELGELVGQKIEILVPDKIKSHHPSLVSGFYQAPAHLTSTGRSSNLAGRRKDGSEFLAEISLSPIHLSGSNDLLVACSLRDITQRVAAEMELRKLSMAVEQSPSVIYITDKQGVIEYVNEQFTEVTGYTREESIGRKPNLLKSGKVPPSVYEELWSTILSGKVWSGELINRAKDGREFWVHVLISPMQRDKGVITHFITAAEDITEREQAQQQLQRANFLADTALELTKAGPWHVTLSDPDYYFSSEKAEAIYGNPPRTDQRYHLQTEWLKNIEAADPKIAALVEKEFNAALHGKLSVYNSIYPYRRPVDGQIVWIHAIARLVRDDEGHATHMYGVSQDVTDSKLAVLELDKARQAAESANQAKTLFLATMSHEIRTPMNAVINMTQLTLDTDLSARQRQYVSAVNVSARSLLALINDILDFSKIEAGKMELEARPFSLHRLLEEITESFRGRVLEKGIEFLVYPDSNVPDEIVGDSLRLRQILINLIGNAFKFTEQGEILLRVFLESYIPSSNDEPGQLRLRFLVKDSGIGIPKDKQSQLFNAFTQVDSTTSRKYGGTGLGLAISKRLVEMMDGSLWLESDMGYGTTFFFTAEFGCESLEAPKIQMPADFKDLRVLIIDDHPNSRDILKSLVERFGMHGFVAPDGDAGLKMLVRANIQRETEHPFDLVILDWIMPGKDGLGVAAEISKLEGLKELPVIMISSYASKEQEAEAEALGIKAFVHKPFTASSLFDALAGLYGGMQAALLYRSSTKDSPPPDFEEFRNVSILMAEDNEANQFVAQELLHSVGIELDIAENGIEAIARLEESTDYACILMDMQMPKMDGITATHEIRKRWPDLKIPIIALTANAMKSDQENCLAAGMDDFLSKPIDRAELFKTLHRWIDPNTANAPKRPAKVQSTPQPLPGTAHKTPAKPDDIPELAGIDVPKALARLGLPWPSLRRIFLSFGESQPQVLEELKEALRTNHTETIRLHAHSIAGSAGSLSATELQTRAKALEMAVKNQTGDLEALHAHMLEEMETVLASIQTLAPSAEPPPTVVPPVLDAESDLRALAKAIVELKEQLDTGDVDGIQRCLELCHKAGIPTEHQKSFEKIQRFADDFCFPEAAEIISLFPPSLTSYEL